MGHGRPDLATSRRSQHGIPRCHPHRSLERLGPAIGRPRRSCRRFGARRGGNCRSGVRGCNIQIAVCSDQFHGRARHAERPGGLGLVPRSMRARQTAGPAFAFAVPPSVVGDVLDLGMNAVAKVASMAFAGGRKLARSLGRVRRAAHASPMSMPPTANMRGRPSISQASAASCSKFFA
jgi:hypothetical protein